jgi:cysteine desulfurase
VGVDRDGRVDPQDIERAIRSDTALVSVMMANNEIGTIMPLRTIADIAHRNGICFHTDAVQAPGLLPLAVDQIGADLLSLSAHKFYGPKGMGILYVRPGTHWRPQQHGGSQENRRRAGTENVAGAVGLATALQIAEASRPAEVERLTMLRNRLISYILSRVPKAQLTGHPDNRLAHHASFVFEGVEGESIVMGLDLRGIAASTGSACTSASLDPSHVLLALGLPAHLAVGSLRLSLGRHTTEQAVEQVASAVQEIVARLRNEQRIAAADTAAM